MKFIEWTDEYSVNLAKMDGQHQQLFDLINEMHEAMIDGRAEHTMTTVIHELATMVTVLKKLMDYTSYHFSMEEDYMVEYAYPECDAHKGAHRMFIERVQALRRDFDDGQAIRSMEIAAFIRDWWLSHILVVDKKLGAFLNEKDIT